MTPFAQRIRPAMPTAALIVLGVLCFAAYFRGLSGGYLFDDFPNIVDNPALRAIATPAGNWFAAILSSGSGEFRRPISMLSFALNISIFGMDPWALKLTNLVLHLGNGLLLYFLSCNLASRLLEKTENSRRLDPTALACFVTGVWLLHPLNVSTVLYVVQRMNQLCAFFTLAGLLCYVHGRKRSLRGESAMGPALVGLVALGALATLSKENGVLILAYAAVIEVVCFRFEGTAAVQTLLKRFFWTVFALALVLPAIFLATHPQWLHLAYAERTFTLDERLLSEARILCHYLLWIFVPNPAWMGIYHDDLTVSTGLLSPVSTALAIGFLCALAAIAWIKRNRWPGLTFGVAWFLAGHLMESTFIPLELVFEHRNYLPMAGLLLGVACFAASLVPETISRQSLVSLGVVIVLAAWGITGIRVAAWADPATMSLTDAENHPRSARSQYEAGRALVAAGASIGQQSEAEKNAAPFFERSAHLDKLFVFPACSAILIKASEGPVPVADVDDLAYRLRNAPLYVQANPFLDMLVAITQRKNFFSAKDISQLTNAALANPRFPTRTRAMLLNNYGAYQLDVLGDAQAAISLTIAAANEEPANPYFQINLAKIALAVGSGEEAAAYLKAASQLNRSGAYDQTIRDLRARVPSLNK